MKTKNFWAFGLVGVLILGACLRLYHLGFQSYWIDEMVSLYFTSRPSWGDIFLDNHPILYHAILKPWIMIFGVSEFATRFLSVIFSVVTTFVLYRLVWKITKERVWALVAAFFHAFSAFSIIYAQETRMYALLEMTTVFNLYYFYELFFEKSARRSSWIGFIASSFALAATHYVALLVLIYEGLFLISQKVKVRKETLWGLGVGGLVLLVSFLYQFSWWALDWQKTKYTQEPMARTPLEALIYISHLNIFNLIFYVILFGFAYWLLHKNKNKRVVFFWLLSLIVLTLFVLQLASFVTQRSLMLPRYFIFLNPVWIALTAFCLSVIRKKTVWYWFGAIACLALLWLPKSYFNMKAPWREASIKITEDSLKPTVITTRTLAIAVPYLEQKNIPIERLSVAETLDLATFQKRVKKGESLWIMENYWGSINYLPPFIEALKSTKLKVETYAFQNPLSEPVLLVRLTR